MKLRANVERSLLPISLLPAFFVGVGVALATAVASRILHTMS